jgi:hypothetical protein
MTELNNYTLDETTEEEEFRKIIEEGNIGDIIYYSPVNESYSMTFRIIEGNAVNGKVAEIIGDRRGLFGPNHPKFISDGDDCLCFIKSS